MSEKTVTTTRRRLFIGGSIYLLVAIFTFGYAAHHTTCNRFADRMSEYDDDYMGCTGQGVVTGIGAMLFWPLYWSWEVSDVRI